MNNWAAYIFFSIRLYVYVYTVYDEDNYTRAIRMNKEATIEAHLVENSHLEAGSE